MGGAVTERRREDDVLRVASARLHPSSGAATILGRRLGRVPVSRLQPRIGVIERNLAARFYPTLTTLEVVRTGVTGTTSLLEESLDGSSRVEARRLLAHVGVDGQWERTFVELSEGERARTLLARALIGDAALLVLDEPVVGLDLAGRELLLDAVAAVSRARPHVAMLLACHHLEEVPTTVSHALLLAGGRIVAAGPIETTITDELLSACYGLPTRVTRMEGRLFALATLPEPSCPPAQDQRILPGRSGSQR